MKKLLILLGSAAAFASCSSPEHKTTTTDSVFKSDTTVEIKTAATPSNPSAIASLCFLNTENKDSTSVELVIKGNKVTGVMNWLPYQKDSRKGKLDGTVKDNVINATWTFMQEGMTDTLDLAFKLSGNTLLQKPLKLNTKTGRQQTDTNAGYTVTYKTSELLHK